MTTIPQDIMAAAWRPAIDAVSQVNAVEAAQVAIARAILAERQRCVDIALASAARCRKSIRAKQSNHDAALFESAAGEAADIATAIQGA